MDAGWGGVGSYICGIISFVMCKLYPLRPTYIFNIVNFLCGFVFANYLRSSTGLTAELQFKTQ